MNDLSDLQTDFQTSRAPRISVVLPLRNAADEIADRIAELAVEAEFSHINICEIIAVDDDSDDLTWASLQSLAWREPRLRPMRLRKSFGLEAAREAGALAATGDIIVTLEPDVPATDIAQLEALIEDGHDVVTGWRPRRRRDRLSFTGRLGGLRLRNPLSATAAYRRDALAALSREGTALAHMAFAAKPAGYSVGEMTLAAPGVASVGESVSSLAGLLGAMGSLHASERKLGVALMVGFLLMCLGVAVPLGGLAAEIAGWSGSLMLPMLAGGALFVSGIQVTGLALVGSIVLNRTGCQSRSMGRVAETLLKHGARD